MVTAAAAQGITQGGPPGIELGIWADQQEDLGREIALLRAYLETIRNLAMQEEPSLGNDRNCHHYYGDGDGDGYGNGCGTYGRQGNGLGDGDSGNGNGDGSGGGGYNYNGDGSAPQWRSGRTAV
jgi:hypothetical protein